MRQIDTSSPKIILIFLLLEVLKTSAQFLTLIYNENTRVRVEMCVRSIQVFRRAPAAALPLLVVATHPFLI